MNKQEYEFQEDQTTTLINELRDNCKIFMLTFREYSPINHT